MRNFKIWFAVGAVLIAVSLIIQNYPASVISGLELSLEDTEISQDERSKLRGALNSWRIWQITTFSPMTSILFAVGIIAIVYSIITGSFEIAQKYKIERKE